MSTQPPDPQDKRQTPLTSTPNLTVGEMIENLKSKKALVDDRIYFLGLGAVGKLIAHAFTDMPEPPPMTLIFHRKSAQAEFGRNGGVIEYIKDGRSDLHRGYDTDLSFPVEPEDQRPPIVNLIVATKAPKTVAALMSIKHRLLPDSTIVLLQNGMGLIEELNEKVFPDIELRPNYIHGIVSHAVYNKSLHAVEHRAIGNIALTALPKTPFEGVSSLVSPVSLLAPSTRYMLRTLTRTPLLGALAMSPTDHILVQLEKLASNCVINPLTAIFGCTNGELIQPGNLRLIRLLLAEISLVIRSLPEIADIPGIEYRFGPASLEHRFMILATQTAKNRSSMLYDIDRGRQTEIEYLNGYVFRRGELLGIRTMVNFTIKHLVGTKSYMSRQGYEKMLPMGDNEEDFDK